MTTTQQTDRPAPDIARASCPCALEGHACPGVWMLAADDEVIAADIYAAGVAYAKAWRDEMRLFRWTRDPW